jgi:hypothetical protein
VRLTGLQAELLTVIATSDHQALTQTLQSRARWWADLRALERRHLVCVAVVGPHRARWPWITVQVTPTGHTHLNNHHHDQPFDQESSH